MTTGSLLGLRYARLILTGEPRMDAEALKREYRYLYIVAYRPLTLPGFAVSHRKTPVIDLTRSLDEVRRRFNATTRNEIARTERIPGLAFAVPDQDLDQAFRLYRRVKRRDGAVPETRAELAQCLIASAYLDGRIVVSATCYAEPPVLRLKTLASARKERAVDARVVGYAGRRLVWELCRYGNANGFATLDLGIVNLTDPAKAGIVRFKQGFGGEVMDTYIYRYETPAFRMLRRLAELARVCEIH